MTDEGSPPVVVGIDGSKAALRAALWAVDEAITRDTTVRLVCAVTAPHDHLDEALARARHALRDASAAVEGCGQPVKVETDALQGDPVDVLTEASRSAALVCVGWKGTHDSGDAGRGSTAARVAREAHSPVAIVRRRHTHEGVGPNRWIVAVLTESPDAHAVLHTAMDEAQLRHASILALTPWGQTSGHDGGADIRAKLDRYLEDADRDDADIQICALPRPDNMLNLLTQSADVDQLVVASADDSRLLAELVGPPIRAVLKGTNCSVLFLRDGGTDSPGTKSLEE